MDEERVREVNTLHGNGWLLVIIASTPGVICVVGITDSGTTKICEEEEEVFTGWAERVCLVNGFVWYWLTEDLVSAMCCVIFLHP